MSGGLAALGPRTLFSVEGVTYCWDDVLASASARGSLEQLRSVSRQGLACVRRSEVLEDGLDQEALSAAATSFRYERGLLSAEELDAWLERWGLTVGEWSAYLERSLLLERWEDELDAIEADASLNDAALARAEFVDAVCSGFLEEEAQRFAADAALAGVPNGEVGDRTALVAWIEAAAAAARDGLISDADVNREISTHALDWTRLELDALELADEGAAREAALCVRVDGRAIADVAADVGAPVRHLSVLLADVEPNLKPSVLAAQPGDLVGPVENNGAFVLLAIHARTLPTATDHDLRERAESGLIERAVKRAMESRVEWHDDL
jgi:hypothetical protein